MEDQSHVGPKPNYHYYLDGKAIQNDGPTLSGADIRAKLPPDQKNYSIYLETEGDEPDRVITDQEVFSLERHIPHFFTVPPANFGGL